MIDRRPCDDPARLLDECREFDVEKRNAVSRAVSAAYDLARRQVLRSACTAIRANATARDHDALLADVRIAQHLAAARQAFEYDIDRLLLTEAEKVEIYGPRIVSQQKS